MKARKVIIFTLLAILILSTLACGGGGDGDGDDDGVTEIKIGMGLPLSGWMGAYVGLPAKQAYELMADRIGVFEVGGKQYRWKLIFEDNEGGTASGGMASTTRFIYDHDVDFVIQQGAAAMASQDLCEASGVVMDMGTAPFDAFGSERPHATQSGPCLTVLVAAFYDWLAEEHPEVERIVVNTYDDPILIAYSEAFGSNMHEYFGFECETVPLASGSTEYYPVATAMMAKDPDLVIAAVSILDVMWDMGYEGLGVQFGPLLEQGLLEQAGWDDCKGLLFFYPEWYGAEEVWPEGVACAKEYESRYSVEMGTTTFAACMNLLPLTGALQQAGTVDDTEKIMEVIHSRTTFDSMVGPVYYGGEAFVGTNCLLMWPVAIWEVVGEREYELLHYYTPEEAEAIAVEAWTATIQ
jgi:ABC-type branched-subunit amino acid transport system substrate-binding protein